MPTFKDRLYQVTEADKKVVPEHFWVAVHQMLRYVISVPNATYGETKYWAIPDAQDTCVAIMRNLLADGYTGIDMTTVYESDMTKIDNVLQNLKFGNHGD